MNTQTTNTRATSASSFSADVTEASRHSPVLVDFWAEWCGPCKAMHEPLEQIAAERAGSAVVAKVDVDSSPELAAQFGIRAIPSLLIFKGGRVVDTLVGTRSKAEVLRHLDKAIAEPVAA